MLRREVRRFLEMRHGLLGAEIGPAHVDLVHPVEALHRRRDRAGEADRRGVVHEDVDAAEALERCGDGRLDLRLIKDIGRCREGLTPSLSHRRGVWNCSRQLRMRLRCFCGDDDVRAGRLRHASENRVADTREAPVMNSVLPFKDMVHRLHRFHGSHHSRGRPYGAWQCRAPGTARRRGSYLLVDWPDGAKCSVQSVKSVDDLYCALMSAQDVLANLRELAIRTGNADGAQRLAWGPVWRDARQWFNGNSPSGHHSRNRCRWYSWATLKGSSDRTSSSQHWIQCLWRCWTARSA